ncbi:hypothetical protein BH09BAC3_BH09BAC3_27940 [soil metagenome]
MKNLNRLIILVASLFVFVSCDHTVSMETTVDENGKLDKAITFQNKDSAKNILGISGKSGWVRTVNTEASEKKGKDTKWSITWRKSFASAVEANTELAVPSDTLFRVTSTFEKKFRWFYTYLYYADTYHAINRMKMPIENFVTQEDYSFIDRLPAEGKEISKSDNLYLAQLNTKLFDVYGTRAIYEEYYDLHAQLISDKKLETRWLDTLLTHKESIFEKFNADKNIGDDYFLQTMDSVQIPLPYGEMKDEYTAILKPWTSRMNFISTANDGKYAHRINMPWTVVRTNADSVVDNQLFWKPPVVKFLIKDYTMFGEARQLNVWAIAGSVVLVGLTVFVFMRKRAQKY